MMEVHPPVTCLSPTQRLPSHQAQLASFRVLASSPPIHFAASNSPLPSTMIIESSLHTSVSSSPDSPQQGETVPGTNESQQHFGLQKERNLPLDDYQKSINEELWKDNNMPEATTVASDEFCQDSVNSEMVDREGSSSPHHQHVHHFSPKHNGLACQENGDASNECYTPPSTQVTFQDSGDRRTSRRKQTLEDIVRRMRTCEEDVYESEEEEDEEEMDMHVMHLDDDPIPEDEVDGTPIEMRSYLDKAQACAESVIKRTMQGHIIEKEDMEQDEEEFESENSMNEPDNFLNPELEPRQMTENLSHRSMGPLSQMQKLEQEASGLLDRKPVMHVMHKSPIIPHPSPSLGGGVRPSHPFSSNISESAYSPHHYSASKMNGWYTNSLPPLFPFSTGNMMDHPAFGHKFLPFEGKLTSDVDKDYLKCNYCERTFRRQKNLENHIENTHQGKGPQRPKRENGDMYFKCTHCPYTTKHQSNLYVHLRIHTGERPYICGACGVQYSQSHSLKSHIINKHDGIMSYYIKEKRNRSPRGLGYMTTQVVAPGDPTIFKLPPPPGLPSLQQSNLELVAKAIEMAKNSSAEMHHQPQPQPPLLSSHPQLSMSHAVPQHSLASPLISPSTPITAGPHGVFKHAPQFPFNGSYFGSGLPYPDLPANPTPAMIPTHNTGSRHLNGLSTVSPGSGSNYNGYSKNDDSGTRNEIGLNLTSSPTSTPSNHSHPPTPNTSKVLSPLINSLKSPNSNNNNNNSKVGEDCGAIDLSKKAQEIAPLKGFSDSVLERISCRNCAHASKLKMLRFNVVRMLSILVPNLNFEEKGISADSDSVDELLQDVIESNTHDDDLL